MNLTDHFTEEEFTHSDNALRLGLDNSLPDALRLNAIETCQLLERIRTLLASLAGTPVPIIITSGYRSPSVNQAAGSGSYSDHLYARAADFRAPEFGTPLQVCEALAPKVVDLAIGQLIFEFGQTGWTHVSTRMPDKRVNRIITVDRTGTRAGIQP